MDRLICGDVGYGKTEIAVRAAFKAVQDGKQVAILVPTTLLVQQHYSHLRRAVRGVPRHGEGAVAVPDRRRGQGGDRRARRRLGRRRGRHPPAAHRRGAFKDLGLVIVDEEQRFGVEHKEALKKLRTNVDVLSMSATPIPRTLEMAVTGIREMSTLATPPEERHPVLTFVGSLRREAGAAAIRRELLREGQVFYVHNRCDDREGRRPAARAGARGPVAVAHGQMNEHARSRSWSTSGSAADVLVCTTIVETGLDISNANTLIVERADLLGLSQLHQLRGRVGRGRERGLRLLPLPAGEAAHRDRARPARHDRRAHRPRAPAWPWP
jgi:transcription-repair coupling factor (superfamily II helicase)